MSERKIVVDTCVIIAASIYYSCSHIPGDIIEKDYATSNSFLGYIKNNKIRGVQILDISVDKAKEKFSDIIYRNISKKTKKDSTNIITSVQM